MWNAAVSMVSAVLGRLLVGVLDLSFDHPILLSLILATLAGVVVVVWLDLIWGWFRAPQRDAGPSGESRVQRWRSSSGR